MGPFSVSIMRFRVLARGQTMAEYALILATIVLVIAALYTSSGTIIAELVHIATNQLLGT